MGPKENPDLNQGIYHVEHSGKFPDISKDIRLVKNNLHKCLQNKNLSSRNVKKKINKK